MSLLRENAGDIQSAALSGGTVRLREA
jgi:hypothetical protein